MYYGRRANDELHFYCNADDHVRKFIAWERRCDRIYKRFILTLERNFSALVAVIFISYTC